MNPESRSASTLRRVGLAVVGLLITACARVATPPAPRNLLLISVDTLRADKLGTYGATQEVSPHIDALARQSVVFENAISQSSWTLPAFASMITSTYPSTHEVDHFSAGLAPSFETLAEVLSAAGFSTAAVTSHVYVGPKFGMDQGITTFDDSLIAGNRQAELKVSSPDVSALGIRRLEQASAGAERWFLWLHYFDPHFPYVRHDDPAAPEGAGLADYEAEIAFTDRWIGEVLAALERLGAADDTLVVLVSDHGEEFREHKKLRHGCTLFREVVHVPLIARVPGLAPARVRDPVSHVDVLPTVLELLGLSVPATAAGRSLVPAMLGDTLEERPILSELRLNAEYHADSLQLGHWKLVLDHSGRATLGFAEYPGGPPSDESMLPHPPGGELAERQLLYRIDRDPGEQHDLAAEHPDVVASLRATLEAMQRRARAAASAGAQAVEHTPDELEVLRRLGYVGSEEHPGD
jgi:choline-sulfatase